MKIVFAISSFKSLNTGIGGHYRSFQETVEAMASAGHSVDAVCIGNQQSPVLQDWKGQNAIFIPFSLRTTFHTILTLKRVVDKANAEVIHAFDLSSALFARVTSYLTGVPFCVTICGRRPPKRYYPKIRNLAVFTVELQRYFQNKTIEASAMNLRMIPNRVRQFECSHVKMSKIQGRRRPGAITVLRICRLVEYYERSVKQTLELATFLRSHSIDCQAVIVGQVVDESVKARLQSQLSDGDCLITDAASTHHAKEVIDIADWVVGTGRSYMEAASRGKVMFCPSADFGLPILVGPDNFDEAFAFNFSERVRVSKSEESNAECILAAARQENVATALRGHAIESFLEYFCVSGLASQYEAFYANYVPPRLVDVLDLPLQIASFVNLYRRCHERSSRVSRSRWRTLPRVLGALSFPRR